MGTFKISSLPSEHVSSASECYIASHLVKHYPVLLVKNREMNKIEYSGVPVKKRNKTHKNEQMKEDKRQTAVWWWLCWWRTKVTEVKLVRENNQKTRKKQNIFSSKNIEYWNRRRRRRILMIKLRIMRRFQTLYYLISHSKVAPKGGLASPWHGEGASRNEQRTAAGGRVDWGPRGWVFRIVRWQELEPLSPQRPKHLLNVLL